MLLTSVHVENLFTFDTFDLVLGGQSVVIVGPNGAGKSNIVRILDVVRTALDWASNGTTGSGPNSAATQALQSFAGARHYGQPSERPTVVRLGVEFTTDSERQTLATYVRAAILYRLLQDLQTVSHPDEILLDQWVTNNVVDDELEPLFKGIFQLRHVGMATTPWEVSYEFSYQNIDYIWLLSGPNITPSIIQKNTQSTSNNPAYTDLRQTILNLPQNSGPGTSLASIPTVFSLDSLFPGEGKTTIAPALHVGTSTFNQRLPVFRQAIELLGLPFLPNTPSQVFPLSYALKFLLDEGLIVVGEQFRGIGHGSTTRQLHVPLPDNISATRNTSRAPWLLPLRLFSLKNGSSAQRARFAQIQAMFSQLAPGRSCEVTFQISPQGMNPTQVGAGQIAMVTEPAGTERDVPQTAGLITIVVDRTDDTGDHPSDLPVQLHGSGTWDALVIAEALVEAAYGRVIVLDEPAVTFHPTWQRTLQSRLRSNEGQLLLVTHSTHLVPMGEADDLTRIVRLDNETSHTRPNRLDPTVFASLQLDQIRREFSLSADAKALLFARGVVLVEGETEAGILPGWFGQSATRNGQPPPAELDIEIYSVNGDTHFRPYLSVLNAFGIPWAVVCDGAAFEIENRRKSTHIFEQVIDAAVEAPDLTTFLKKTRQTEAKVSMSQEIFNEQKTLGEANGIFTLALGWSVADKKSGRENNESFEAFINSIDSQALAEASQQVGGSKVRMGQWIAEHRNCPDQVGKLYDRAIATLEHKGLRR